ncbi:hypothetical protein CDL12_18287 [Handroanthus impetiginosus]|uniref:Triacylglycerol lipase n=1 Tax=Handroanthus impetiginosus TaxID=429701 RepID=A0A2G9GVA4_9LAMI|nr:hypothetical protein CDL12_18287 [Handroanthus impetiginosus]
MYRRIPRLRTSSSSIMNFLTVAQLRRKALNSLSAVQDTFYSTKDIFERHRVVFTISTSIASVATAWAGYTLRHLHDSRVDQRLESIEKTMKNNYHLEDPELKRLVSGTVSLPACVATVGTSLIIGYGLGWRGGAWYANRKFRKEQMKLLGQMKSKGWPLKFLRRPLIRPRLRDLAAKISERKQKDAFVARSGMNTNTS